jgi:hypothetical protein
MPGSAVSGILICVMSTATDFTVKLVTLIAMQNMKSHHEKAHFEDRKEMERIR